jgi:hypothetical protein
MTQPLAACVPLGCFRVAFRTLIKLLLALDSAEVKRLSLIGACCGCTLRVDLHSTNGITHRRRLAFHDSLLKFIYSSFDFKGSAVHALLAHSLVAVALACPARLNRSARPTFWSYRSSHRFVGAFKARALVRVPSGSPLKSGTCIASDSYGLSPASKGRDDALQREGTRASSRTQWTEDFVNWFWYGFQNADIQYSSRMNWVRSSCT